MNPKLSDWASIAEIVSGVAVVVTLVMLFLGIRENTSITRASMYSSAIAELNAAERAILSDSDLSRVWRAFAQMNTSDLSEEDATRLNLIVAAMARNYDMAFSMRRYELFGENEWERYERLICRNYERVLSAGQESTFLGLGSIEFRTYVESSC